jgi:hypothetical protein
MTLGNLREVAYIPERASDVGAADEVWANLRAPRRPGGVRTTWRGGPLPLMPRGRGRGGPDAQPHSRLLD